MGLWKGSVSSFEPSFGQNGARKAMLLAEGEKVVKHQSAQTCPSCENEFGALKPCGLHVLPCERSAAKLAITLATHTI